MSHGQDDLPNSDVEGFVLIANDILSKCKIIGEIESLHQCSDAYFVAIYEGILGEPLKGIIPDALNHEDKVHNCITVVDALSCEVLNVDLSHITADDIVNGDIPSIQNLLEIFKELLEFILDVEVEEDQYNDQDEQNDSNILSSDHEVISDVLHQELGPSSYAGTSAAQHSDDNNHVRPVPHQVSSKNIIDVDISMIPKWNKNELASSSGGNSTDEIIRESEIIERQLAREYPLLHKPGDPKIQTSAEQAGSSGLTNRRYNAEYSCDARRQVLSKTSSEKDTRQQLNNGRQTLTESEKQAYDQNDGRLLSCQDPIATTHSDIMSDLGSDVVQRDLRSRQGLHTNEEQVHKDMLGTQVKTRDLARTEMDRSRQDGTKKVSQEPRTYQRLEDRGENRILRYISGSHVGPHDDNEGSKVVPRNTRGLKANDTGSGLDSRRHEGYRVVDRTGVVKDNNGLVDISGDVAGPSGIMGGRGLPTKGTHLNRTLGVSSSSGQKTDESDNELSGGRGGVLGDQGEHSGIDGDIRDYDEPLEQQLTSNRLQGRDYRSLKNLENRTGTNKLRVHMVDKDDLGLNGVYDAHKEGGSKGIRKVVIEQRGSKEIHGEDTEERRSWVAHGTKREGPKGVLGIEREQRDSRRIHDMVREPRGSKGRQKEPNVFKRRTPTDDIQDGNAEVSSDTSGAMWDDQISPLDVTEQGLGTKMAFDEIGTNAKRIEDAKKLKQLGKNDREQNSSSVFRHYHHHFHHPHGSSEDLVADVERATRTARSSELDERSRILTKSAQTIMDRSVGNGEKRATSAQKRSVKFDDHVDTLLITNRLERLRKELGNDEKEQCDRRRFMKSNYGGHLEYMNHERKRIEREVNQMGKTVTRTSPRPRKLKRAARRKSNDRTVQSIYGKKSAGRKARFPSSKARKRSTSCSPKIRQRKKAARQLEKGDVILPTMLDEFPFLHVSPHTMQTMRKKQTHQLNTLSKPAAQRGQQTKTQKVIEDAEKRQQTLLKILRKDLLHNQRMREQKERDEHERAIKSRLRDKRQASARARRYYEDYQLRMRARLLKRRTREEQIFKNLFEDGLEIQKQRVNELRTYAKEQRESRAQRQQNDLESLENYYRDQYAMLAETISHEKEALQIREKAQEKVIHQMQSNLRDKLKKEVCDIQETLVRDEDDAYFRRLDAERLRRQMQMAAFQNLT